MNQHRLIVIGTGSIGERHVRCFKATQRAAVSICEANDSLRRTIAERYDTRHAFANLSEVPWEQFDAVVICTPAHLHIEMARLAMDAGKHVLIEKPLSVSMDGVEELRERQRSVVVGVAYVMRMHPTLIAVKKVLQEERFGKVVQWVYNGGQHFPHYRPAYREIYYVDRARGGGAVQDALTHVINVGQWMLGPISSLVADAAHQVLEGVEVEDTVHVICRHQNVMASYGLNQHQAVNDSSMTIVCERGVIKVEPLRHRWSWQTTPDEDWVTETMPELHRDDLFVAQANMFLDAIERGDPVACTFDEATKTLLANRAILESVEQRRWIEL